MTSALRTFLQTTAHMLDEMERQGAETDSPEGARYIQVSDTFARQVSTHLRMFARVPPPALALHQVAPCSGCAGPVRIRDKAA